MGTWIDEFIRAGNAQLENAILSRILVSRKLIPDILPDYFTGQRRRLYEAIKEAWEEFNEIDAVYLKATGFDDEVENAVQESGSASKNTIRDLHELWQKREMARVVYMATSTYDNEDITTEEVIRRIQEGSSKILLRNQNHEYNHYDSVVKLNELIIDGNKNNREILGFSTGLKELDRYTSGIERGKTYAIGALKKTGKSRFSIGLAIALREQGANIVWNRLEMGEMQLNLLALANYSDMDSMALGMKIQPENMGKIQEGISKLNDLDWRLIREQTVPGLRAKVIELQNKKPVDVVIVDYIQRMSAKGFGGERRAQEVEAISKGLADIGSEIGVGMIILSQLSKEAERLGQDEMPNMSHMKESQGLAEASDCIITLHDPMRSENTTKADGYELHETWVLVEQRYGLSGAKFRILSDLRTCRFYNHNSPYL
jgi:replicative DNA helicase